jgi:single-strand DNA-binding protein
MPACFYCLKGDIDMYSQIVIVGNIGSDAEVRTTPSGQSVANFSVACNRKWTDNAGVKQEQVTWFRVAVWGKFAEATAPYLTKGKLVLVEGSKIAARAYTNNAGEAAASLELTADTIRFLGGNGGNGSVAASVEVETSELTMDEIPF